MLIFFYIFELVVIEDFYFELLNVGMSCFFLDLNIYDVLVNLLCGFFVFMMLFWFI